MSLVLSSLAGRNVENDKIFAVTIIHILSDEFQETNEHGVRKIHNDIMCYMGKNSIGQIRLEGVWVDKDSRTLEFIHDDGKSFFVNY